MSRFFLSLILFLILSCSPLMIYQDLPEVKAWEKEIEKFEELDKKEEYAGNAIIFAGSSSIRLWSALAEGMDRNNKKRTE